MAKQLNISFKSNELEEELYNFVKSKFSPANYIKELLHQALLTEKGQITIPITTNNTLNSQNKEDKEIIKEEVEVDDPKVVEPSIDEQETEVDLDEWSDK